MAPLHIVVIGSGPTGLAAAWVFGKQGYQITVLEREASVPQVGGAIAFAPNGVRVLARHELLADFIQQGKGGPIEAWPARDHTGKLLTEIPLPSEKFDPAAAKEAMAAGKPPVVPQMGVKRGDFATFMHEQITSKLASNVTFLYGATVTDIESATGIVKYKQDGGAEKSVQGTFVLGADGINSVAKSCFNTQGEKDQDASTKKKTGNCSDALIIPGSVVRDDPDLKELAKPGHAALWVGPNAHMVLLPTANGDYGLNTSRPDDGSREQWDLERDTTKLREFVKDWDPRIDKLVAGAQSGVKIGITFLAAASSWSKERVLLLGDAAHAMLPFTGQGLSQGLEDVDLLSVLLSKNGLTPQSSGEPQELFPIIGKCFMMLQKMRSPRTNLISKAAIDNIDVFESADPEYVKTRDAKFAEPPNPGHVLLWKNPMISGLVWGFDASCFYQDFLDGKLPGPPPGAH